MSKKLLITAGAVIVAATLTIAVWATADLQMFEMQDVVLHSCPGEGLILDIGGGGEGIIGRLMGDRVVAVDLSREELEGLLDQGRTVVLITHGIHATEAGGPQTAARLVHRLATSNDPKILEILDNVILLDIPSLNPDGLQWIVDWYNRWVGTEYEASPLPWLYHPYTGHDNNRDWYAFKIGRAHV